MHFEDFALSSRTVERVKDIKSALADDAPRSDEKWILLTQKKVEEANTDVEEIEESKEETTSEMLEADAELSQKCSTQYFFTQADNGDRKFGSLPMSKEVYDGVEFLCEGLERDNGKFDVANLVDLSNEQLVQTFNDLEQKLSSKGIYNLCCSMRDIHVEQRIKYIGFLCTHVLLPKVTSLEEPSRLLLVAAERCVELFPDEVQKFIFTPVLNVDLKNVTLVIAIINSFETQRKSVLILEFVRMAKELKEWHIPVLQILLPARINESTYDELIKLFLDKAVHFSADVKFGKLILFLLKTNVEFSEKQKVLLQEIVTVNKTLFKKPMENILSKHNK